MTRGAKFAILVALLPSVAMAQEASTKTRFVGVWLYSGAAAYCSPVLEIDMVNNEHAILGFGEVQGSESVGRHDVQIYDENRIGVKFELTDRDKPISFYNTFTLDADGRMDVSLLGPDGLYPCSYTKASPSKP
jgi:hypothetical protein